VTITLQPIRVRTGSQDTEGRLALADGELIAVFVRLDDEIHGEDPGPLVPGDRLWVIAAGDATTFRQPC
jgi:hypothetical protein